MALWFFFEGVKVKGSLKFEAAGGMFRPNEGQIEPLEGMMSLPFTIEPTNVGEFLLTPHDPDNFTASFSVPFEIRGPHVMVCVETFEGPAEVAWPNPIGSMIRGPLRPNRFTNLEHIGEFEDD